MVQGQAHLPWHGGAEQTLISLSNSAPRTGSKFRVSGRWRYRRRRVGRHWRRRVRGRHLLQPWWRRGVDGCPYRRGKQLQVLVGNNQVDPVHPVGRRRSDLARSTHGNVDEKAHLALQESVIRGGRHQPFAGVKVQRVTCDRFCPGRLLFSSPARRKRLCEKRDHVLCRRLARDPETGKQDPIAVVLHAVSAVS